MGFRRSIILYLTKIKQTKPNYYMTLKLVILSCLSVCFGNKILSQNYILSPNTESSLISLNPGFVGENYKNRLAVNYLYQSHPLGDIQTIQVSNDFDIPKINLRTGIVVSADRIATKNQSIFIKGILAYELPLGRNIKMVFPYELTYASNKFELASYFNRYNYSDTLFSAYNANSSENYFTHRGGMLITHKNFFVGFSDVISFPKIGEINGMKIIMWYNRNYTLGLKFKTKYGEFRPIANYFYYDDYNKNLFTFLPKFSYISCWDVALNYNKNKLILGLGYRNIKYHSNTYKLQVGAQFEKCKIIANVGLTPYNNSTGVNKMASTCQISLEANLKRNKHYHRPVYHQSFDYYSNGSKRTQYEYIDSSLITQYEFYENGQIKVEKNFKNGLLHGLYIENYEDGTEKVSGSYKNGNKNHSWTYYNQETNCIIDETYKDGVLIKTTPCE